MYYSGSGVLRLMSFSMYHTCIIISGHLCINCHLVVKSLISLSELVIRGVLDDTFICSSTKTYLSKVVLTRNHQMFYAEIR